MHADAADREVFAKSAIEKRITLLLQLINDFAGNQKNRFARSTMDSRMGVKVTFEAERSNKASRNRSFREATKGGVDLDDYALHAGHSLTLVARIRATTLRERFRCRNTGRTRKDGAAGAQHRLRSCACNR